MGKFIKQNDTPLLIMDLTNTPQLEKELKLIKLEEEKEEKNKKIKEKKDKVLEKEHEIMKEMLENDEYETTKNTFYKEKGNSKIKKKKKNFSNLSSLQVDYDEFKKKKISTKKAITDNELNNMLTKQKINVKKHKNNLNYNYSLNNINKNKQKKNQEK